MSIQAMAWVGGSLLLCTSLRYAVVDPVSRTCTHLFSLATEAPSPSLILPLPTAQLGILLMVTHAAAAHSATHRVCV